MLYAPFFPRRATKCAPLAMKSKLVAASKFLSFILRHKPEAINLSLDAQGWANLEDLIHLANQKGKRLTRGLVEELVASNDKQRFVIDDGGSRIRARQGHSVAVDVGLIPTSPPTVLFHGTTTRFVPSIRQHGLRSGKRLHVHLSGDAELARKTGERHGSPVVLRIASGLMDEQGYIFYLSENSVWLTGHVPPRFIDFSFR